MQTLLFPPSPRDWLGEDHAVYFLLDLLPQLDLREIESKVFGGDPRGEQPYDPRMMTGLLLYGYCVGIRSSRKIERATYEDLRFRVLAGGQHPDHSRIAAFRRAHLRALEKLFVQILRLCEKAGLVKLGHVALDGTKLSANASKRKAMSYAFMKQKAAKLQREIRDLLAKAEQQDRADEARYGDGPGDDELPKELRRRESRLEKIREAMAELEAEAAETRARSLKKKAKKARDAAKSETPKKGASYRAKRLTGKAGAAAAKANRKAREVGKEPPNLDDPAVPLHEVKANRHGDPRPEAQRNFTDPDSRIMVKSGEFLQAYNCQAAVDGESQVIVAHAATNQPADARLLRPMIDRVEQNMGRLPKQLSADAGYCSKANLALLAERALDAYVAASRVPDPYNQPSPKGRISNALGLIDRMRRRLATKPGRRAYALRKQIVEPVFGQIKEARGIRRFLLRGLDQARGEWALICTGHNLGKLLKALAEISRRPSNALFSACWRLLGTADRSEGNAKRIQRWVATRTSCGSWPFWLR